MTEEIIIRSMAVFHSDMNKSCLSFLDLEIVEVSPVSIFICLADLFWPLKLGFR